MNLNDPTLTKLYQLIFKDTSNVMNDNNVMKDDNNVMEDDLVGKDVSIFWKKYNQYYRGYVKGFDYSRNEHKVWYEDDFITYWEKLWGNMRANYRILDGHQARDAYRAFKKR